MTHTDRRSTDVAPTSPQQSRHRNLHLTACGVTLAAVVVLFQGQSPTWIVAAILAAVGCGVPVGVLALTSSTDQATGAGRGWGTSTRYLVAATLTLALTLSLLRLAGHLAASQQPPNVDVRLFTICVVLGVTAAVLTVGGFFRFPWRKSTWHRSLTHVVATAVLAFSAWYITFVAIVSHGFANWAF